MTELNRFDDIEHIALRNYNRVVLMTNLFTDGGEEAARAYAEMFDENERKQMYVMQHFIQANGLEEAARMIQRKLN